MCISSNSKSQIYFYWDKSSYRSFPHDAQ